MLWRIPKQLIIRRTPVYSFVKPLLFSFDPETSHSLTLKSLSVLHRLSLLKLFVTAHRPMPVQVFGLTFENPVGLAAGLDKNGDYIDCLAALGFGFIEIGTITPRPQTGNPTPRLFRLEKELALINRMGFNNKGVDYLVARVKRKKYSGILGINIGKNGTTSLENAFDDYQICMQKVYPYASYITVNISSPNTPGLRELQSKNYLEELLSSLKKEQLRLADTHHKYIPLLIKIAPDLSSQEIADMAQAFIAHKIDGVIATNTTIDRSQIATSSLADEAGGLSGQPLFSKATAVLKQLKTLLTESKIPIIASGGIMTGEQACEKINAGAQLIQLYTGLIYSGPQLIADSLKSVCLKK